MRQAFFAVAALALVCLLVRAARVGMAGDFVDPVSKITAQDEALYAHSAIQAARDGHWATPRFMGRYALFKPPLLAWLAGASAWLLGISALALRLPVALLCAVAAGLVFLWAAELRSWQAGVCAAVLVVSSHLWFMLASVCMTDGLVVAFLVVAMYCLYADPWLESRGALWGFSASAAAAILAKSVAGLLSLAVLGIYWLFAPRKYRPPFRRVFIAGLLAAALAAPWFVYELTAHGRWFWKEFVLVEILGYGAGAPPQTTQENHFLFYAMRFPLLDPVLTAVALAAAPAFLGALRKRSPGAVLLACWLGAGLTLVLLWQYRNVTYLLPLIPALAVIGAAYGPIANMRPAGWMILLAAAAFLLKASAPDAPWGLSFRRGTVQPVAPIVSSYCAQARANELILVGMDDDLYATLLPLPRLRYALVGAPLAAGSYEMPFHEMGIAVTGSEFNELPRLEPLYRRRLREWRLDSDAPIGTLILAGSPAEFGPIVRAHPDSDFLFPNRFHSAVESDPAHVLLDAEPGHFFLLARESRTRPLPRGWPCKL